jgi:hypothetical protein
MCIRDSSRKEFLDPLARDRQLEQVWFKEGCLLKARAYRAAIDLLERVA